MEKLRELSKGRRAVVRTFGCQQNLSDSEKLRGLLSQLGFDVAENPNTTGAAEDFSTADVIVFNTCAVRENAENRVFGHVGALKAVKAANPSLIIAVCGCMTAQPAIAEKLKLHYPYVDIIFGTSQMSEFPQMLYDVMTEHKRIFEPVKTAEYDGINTLPPLRDAGTRALVPIMYGCNNFCTYCIVPYVRGRERSRAFDEVVSEVREAVSAGYSEILLLGQNVNSYNDGERGFAELLLEIDKIDGDFAVEYMSSHPKDFTTRLVDIIADSGHISHRIHLPLQSGSDRVLSLMNRRYTVAQYLSLVEYAREKIKDVRFTTDIIVGFPEETAKDFELTLAVLEKVRFSQIFSFVYSRRGGTAAAEMPDHVPREEKMRWFAKMLALQKQIETELKNC